METVDDETVAAAFVRWPGHFLAGETLNGIVAHEDWLPTFAAIAGAPDIKDKLLKGVELNGRTYKNYIDGYNQLDYLSGKVKESPRNEFIYVNDDGQIVAMRYNDWKVVFLENRGEAFAACGASRSSNCACRCCSICAAIPSSVPSTTRTPTTTVPLPGVRDRALAGIAAQFLQTMQEYLPSQAPGSFNLTKIEEQLRKAGGSH
jgi:hypothetical protein